MKKVLHLFFGLIILINGGEVWAQGVLTDDPLFVESSGSDYNLEPPEARQADWSIVYIGSIIVLETVFLAGSFLTRYKPGSYVVGGLQGIYGVTAGIGALAGYSEYGITPGLLLVGGMGYLSYYNFAFHGRHSNSRKFWTNFLGMNAAVGLAFAGLLYETQIMDYTIGSLTVTPHLYGLAISLVS